MAKRDAHADRFEMQPGHIHLISRGSRDLSVISLPDVADVSFPALIGQVSVAPAPPKKKRKKVRYHGVVLGRRPFVFEAKILALTEIPPRLDAALAAVVAQQSDDAFVRATLHEMATFGATQVLAELARQGAPERTVARMPDLDAPVQQAFDRLQRDRFLELSSVREYHADRVGRQRIPAARRDAIVEHMMGYRAPGIATRYAQQAVNLGFAIGREAAMAQFRRQPLDLAYQHPDTGQFISKSDAIDEGVITVDVVVQSAVMDENTCDECDAVDGEEMEFGDDRQLELHPPYVQCLSTLRGINRCRCVQIALLSDGSEIDVDEVPEGDTITDGGDDTAAKGAGKSGKGSKSDSGDTSDDASDDDPSDE